MHSFREFWPHYVREHSTVGCRLLHYIGTTLVLAAAVTAVYTHRWWLLALLPVFGYGFAWTGHFVVEKNRPATFTHPFYSLAADWVMYWKMLGGQMPAEVKRALATRP